MFLELFDREKNNKVLVVSHERSGTHFLINTIALNFPYYSNRVIPFSSMDTINPSSKQLQKVEQVMEKKFHSYFNKHPKRIFKSHLQYYFVKNYFEELTKEYEIFYIVRNGKDVLTSMFYFCKNYQNLPHKPFPIENNFSNFIRLKPYNYPFDGSKSYKKSENFVSRWVNHVESWLKVQNEINIIKYENLKNNFENEINTISKSLQISPPQKIQIPQLSKSNSISPRKGKINDWKNIFSEKDKLFFSQHAEKLMKKLNYEI